MFARISHYAVGDAVGDAGNADLALAWIELQNSQSVVARRQRLNCPPFQLFNGTGGSENHAKQHRLHNTHVCCAVRGSRQSKRVPGQRTLRNQALTKVRHSAWTVHGGQQQAVAANSTQDALQLHSRTQPHDHDQPQQQPCNPDVSMDPQQVAACIQAAATFSQLQIICNRFLGHAAFTAQHAALVLSRLHLVRSRPGDSQLLLVELLAQLLPAGCMQHQPSSSPSTSSRPQEQGVLLQHPVQQTCCSSKWLSCGDVAAVFWAFSRAGYQPAPHLLQQLLQQFWLAFSQQQQQQHMQPVTIGQQTNQDQSVPAGGLAHQQGQQVQHHSQQQAQRAQQQQQQQQVAHHSSRQVVWPPQHPDEALSTLVAGLAGLSCREVACWQRMRAAVHVALTDSCLPVHALQQLAWGFAAVQQADEATVEALAAALQGRLCELDTPEDLVQAMWSLHLLGCSDTQLFSQAAHHMVWLVQAAGGTSSSSAQPLKAASPAAAQPAVMPPRASSSTAVASSSRPQPSSSDMVVGGHRSGVQPSQQAGAASTRRGLLSVAAAGHTGAVCSQAYGVLQQYDPLLCMLALYKEYSRSAHAM